jgi:hypothetical protein
VTLFSLKGNQGTLHDDVKTFFTSSLAPAVASVSYEGDHGRIETRSLRATDDITWLQERHDWNSLQSIIAVTAKREFGENRFLENRMQLSRSPVSRYSSFNVRFH